MKTFIIILFIVIFVSLITNFIFFKLWRKNRAKYLKAADQAKRLQNRIDYMKNEKEILDEVFNKNKKEKKEVEEKSGRDKYESIMDDFRE